MSINKIRSLLYGSAKFLGHINAVVKGKILRRIFRVFLGKQASKLMKF